MIHLLPTSVKVTYLHLLSFLLFSISFMAALSVSAQDVTEEWARRYDGKGPGEEYFQASAIDGEGNLYLLSTSLAAPAFKNGASTIQAEMLTVKYSPSGEVIWSKRLVSDSNLNIFEFDDEARAIALDGSGGIYVAGVRKDDTFTRIQSQTIVLFKLSAEDGTMAWFSEYADGEGNKEVRAITADKTGVYLVGTNEANSLSQNYLTLKYNGTNGDLAWGAEYDGVGKGQDIVSAVAVDSKGGVIVTGKSYNKFVPFPGQGPHHLVFDIATVKYDAEKGEEQWAATVTGDTLFAIAGPRMSVPLNAFLAVDDKGDVYVTAQYNSIVPNDEVSTGIVTVKYDNKSGDEIWESRYTSNTLVDPAIALDGSGGVYVAGRYGEPNIFKKLFVVKYDASSGEEIWEEKYAYLEDAEIDADLSAPIIKVGRAHDVFVTSSIRRGGLLVWLPCASTT